MHNERAVQSGSLPRPTRRPESGELEESEPKRRKIDCGSDPGDHRQLPRGADRRSSGFPPPPTPES